MNLRFETAAFVLAAAFVVSFGTAGAQTGRAPIEISPERRQLIGLQIATVEEKDLVGKIQTTGTVETRFAGWIRQVYVNQTYQPVTRGQPLFTIYSPDLVNTENEYLIAQQASGHLRNS